MAGEDSSDRHQAGIALAKIDFDILKDALNHENGIVRATAKHTMRNLQTEPCDDRLVAGYYPDVNSLLAGLRDKSPHVREGAAKALGRIKGLKAVDGLIAALNDPDDKVKAAVVHSLGAMGNSRAAEPLLVFLKQQSNARLRELACWALHSMPPEPNTVDAVVGLLNDEDAAVRRTAATTLGEFRQQATVSVLVRALGDEDSQVRIEAAAALARIGPEAAKPALMHSDPWVRRKALHEIGTFDLLVAALNDPDPGIRSFAVIQLSRRKSKISANRPALDAVVKMLADPDPKVRDVTVDMLNRLLGDDAFTYLADALKDDEPRVRCRASDALRKHKGRRTIGILIEALKGEQDQTVQRSLRATLTELTGNDLSPAQWQQWWAQNNPDLQHIKR
jgi:HEAT repeat protein